MRLFIAEKPSMAREISKCLPENKNIQKRNGYFIQGDDVVTWVVGHVLHQAEPGIMMINTFVGVLRIYP